jgi:hypothetical protein
MARKQGAKDRLKSMRERQRREKDAVSRGGGSRYLSLADQKDVKFLNVEKDTRYKIAIIPFQISGRLIDGAYSDEGESFEKGEWWYKVHVFFHRDVGVNRDRVVCRAKTFGKACPICEYASTLPREEAKGLFPAPNPMVYYNVIDLEAKKPEILIFGANHSFFEQEAWGEAKASGEDSITDVGIKFRAEEDSFRGSKFLRFKSFTCLDWDGPTEEQMDSAFPLDEMVKEPTYEYVKALFEGEVAGDKEDEDEDEKPSRSRSRSRKQEDEDEDEKPSRSRKRKDEDESQDDASDEDDAASASDEDDDLPKSIAELEELNLPALKALAEDFGIETKRKRKTFLVEELTKALDLNQDNDDTGNESDDGGECPAGYKFGHDCNEYEECQTCPEETFEACAIEKDKIEKGA